MSASPGRAGAEQRPPASPRPRAFPASSAPASAPARSPSSAAPRAGRVEQQRALERRRRWPPRRAVGDVARRVAVDLARHRRVADHERDAARQRLERRQAEALVVRQERERRAPARTGPPAPRRRRTMRSDTAAGDARAARRRGREVLARDTCGCRRRSRAGASGWRRATRGDGPDQLGQVAAVEDRPDEQHQRLAGGGRTGGRRPGRASAPSGMTRTRPGGTPRRATISPRENSEIGQDEPGPPGGQRGEHAAPQPLLAREPLGVRDERQVVDGQHDRHAGGERRGVGRGEEHVGPVARGGRRAACTCSHQRAAAAGHDPHVSTRQGAAGGHVAPVGGSSDGGA